jgi:hypothetical protein
VIDPMALQMVLGMLAGQSTHPLAHGSQDQ